MRTRDDTATSEQVEVREPLGPAFVPTGRLPPPPVPRRPAAQWVNLSEITDTETFLLRTTRQPGPLGESIAREGQTEPVDLRRTPTGLQLVTGQRRLCAVQLLHRSRILARVHENLSDPQALYLALADDLDRRPWTQLEREAVRAKIEGRGQLGARLEALLERASEHVLEEEVEEQAAALERGTAPDFDELEETSEEEVELEVLADRARDGFADACNDLAALIDVWGELDEARRSALVECVQYLVDLHPFLVAEPEDSDDVD